MDSKMNGSYAKEYFELISGALLKTRVSDSNSQDIGLDDGLSIWAEKANVVKKETGGLIFFCGNGASETMAEHLSHDWFQNAEINTYTCSETAHITAISNDLSYEDVFSYRINRILSDRDMLVAISSSGNSPNIVKAIKEAKDRGAYTISLSGKGADNAIRRMADLNFYVPLEHYGEVESAHAVILHMALDYYLDQFMGGRH